MSARLDPDPRRARVRLGVGAAFVLLLVALGVGVLVAAMTPAGATSVVAPGSAVSGSPTPSPPGSARSASSSRSVAGSSDGAATPDGTALIYVHVLGQVARPGLFRLGDGSRVVDAVAAAGGFTDAADRASVNLARTLTDGEQLYLPAVGETPPVGTGTGAASGAAASGAGPSGVGGKVNLNTADQTALETLPRVGPALAQRILGWRTANGRFTSVEDLMSVSGIGEKTFAGLKDLVTV